MASEAEVDLIISTADALPELERDLQRIVTTAENGAPTVDIEAGFELQRTIGGLQGQLNEIINAVEGGADNVEVQAEVERSLSLNRINRALNEIIRDAQAGADPLEVQAELDEIASALRLELQVAEVVREVEDSAPDIEIEVQIDRDGSGRANIDRLGRSLMGILGPLTKVSAGILGAGLAASSAAPLLASVATSLQAIGPAAAIGVSGMLTVQLAAGTLKLAMQDVGEAVTAALDPGTKPDELAEALEKLAPSAQDFVLELREMRSGLKELQQDVQQNFFQGFDKSLRELGKTVLPVVGNALRQTSTELNAMALGAAQAASQLGRSGVLGQALDSSVASLRNLRNVPGQVVTALGQLGAAAGPSLERITAAVDVLAERVAGKLTKAFESGGLESAISGAVDAIAQLGRVFGNVFAGIGNIIQGFQASGEGLFGTLEKITQAFEDVTASNAFQQALKALSQTMSVIVDTVLPLISTALEQLGPVFVALAAPVQILVRALGEGLQKVFTALGPVLVSIANVFGQLAIALVPIITLAADLIAAILPALIPLFDSLGQIINAMVPFIEQLAKNLSSQLLPVFTALATEVLPQILPPMIELTTRIFPILTKILTELGPSLAELGLAFAGVAVALAPLIAQIAELVLKLVDDLGPVFGPLLSIILNLVELGLKVFTAQLTNLVIPAIGVLVDILQGDFSSAWKGAGDIVSNIGDKISARVNVLKADVEQRLRELGAAAKTRVEQMGRDVVAAFERWTQDAADRVRRLPGEIQNFFSNAGSLLVGAGADIVRGLINGLRSQLGALRAAAQSVADSVSGSVKDFLGIRSPSKVMMEAGEDTMEGFRIGIASAVPDLRRQLQGVAALAPSFALPDGRSLQLPQASGTNPVVQVYLGNQLLDQHVDTRIAMSAQARDLLVSRGVRR